MSKRTHLTGGRRSAHSPELANDAGRGFDANRACGERNRVLAPQLEVSADRLPAFPFVLDRD